jgi:hypothetical protein
MENNEIIPDRNEIITITYKEMRFEIDMFNDIMMIEDEVVDIINSDNAETLPANLFFRRLIDGYELLHKNNTIKI